MCHKTVVGVVLKRHGSLESVVHRKVHATFGGEGLVLLGEQDPASYPTPQESRPERRAEESSVQDEGRQGNRSNLMGLREMRRGQRERSGNWRAGCLESLHVRF
jgi:hypothetical protein